MSVLYWKSKIIATTEADRIVFIPESGGSPTGIPSSDTNVGAAIRDVARRKTGIKETRTINASTSRQTLQITNSYFNNDMYVDYYADKQIDFYDYPSLSGNTLTFYIAPTKFTTGSATFKIVVKF